MKNTFYVAPISLFAVLYSCSNEEIPFERTMNNAVAMTLSGEYDGVILVDGCDIPLFVEARSLRSGIIINNFPMYDILEIVTRKRLLPDSTIERLNSRKMLLRYTVASVNNEEIILKVASKAESVTFGESDSLSMVYDAVLKYDIGDGFIESVLNISELDITLNGDKRSLLSSPVQLRLNMMKKDFNCERV